MVDDFDDFDNAYLDDLSEDASVPPTHAAMIRLRGRDWETLWEGTEAACLSAIVGDDPDEAVIMEEMWRDAPHLLPTTLALIKIGDNPETDYLFKLVRLAKEAK